MIIEGIEIEIVRKKMKNMRIYVMPPNGKVKISAPKHIKEEEINSFVFSKIEWIKKHIKYFENKPKEKTLEYVTGETLFLFGKSYTLEVINSNKRASLKLDNEKIVLKINNKYGIKKREYIINRWYKKCLENQLSCIVDKWQKVMGVHVNELRIRNMTTRWGSCNIEKKRIWINLHLAKKNIRLLEYILVHELTHLLERGHNKRFKNYMSIFMPDWKDRQKELNGRK